MRHGVVAGRYWDMGDDDREHRYNNYISRYHLRHIDLMDLLALYQSRANAPLDAMAKLCGFPGKLGMDGSQVYGAYLEGSARRDPALLRDRRDEHLPAVVPLREDARPASTRPAIGARSACVRETVAAIDEPHWARVPGGVAGGRRARSLRRAARPTRGSGAPPPGDAAPAEDARRLDQLSPDLAPAPIAIGRDDDRDQDDRDDDLHRLFEHPRVVVARRQARIGLVACGRPSRRR